MDILGLVARWAHLLAAITAAGGTLFMRLALAPALDSVDGQSRRAVADAVRSRWAMPLHAAIAFLLASGLYNVVVTTQRYELPAWYHPLFGVKFLLALAIFWIGIMLTGRSAAAQKLQERSRTFLNLNVLLVVIVVLLSGVLRQAPKVEKSANPPAAASPAADR